MPCPYCNPAETKMLEGEGATPEQAAATGRARKSNASLGIQLPSRTLDLDGKTIAGCAVGKMAVNATASTRFHSVMACGHAQIVDGSILMAAERASKTLKCGPCSKVDIREARIARNAARKASKNG